MNTINGYLFINSELNEIHTRRFSLQLISELIIV
jgi:hypothetical protein